MAKTIDTFSDGLMTLGLFFRTLEEEGLDVKQVVHTVRNDKTARAQLVQFLNLLMGSSGTVPSYQRARDILGDGFIAPQEVAEAVGVSYTEAQLAELASTLPSKEVLQWARDNGFAVVAGPPSEANLLDIYELNTDLFYQKNDRWFTDKRQKFARKDTVGTTWLVVRKAPVPNSTLKTWSKQQALLSGNERIPNVAEATWFFTTYAKVRGIRLVTDVYVRTSSVGSFGLRVDVGYFGVRGLRVLGLWDDVRGVSIGVASARK